MTKKLCLFLCAGIFASNVFVPGMLLGCEAGPSRVALKTSGEEKTITLESADGQMFELDACALDALCSQVLWAAVSRLWVKEDVSPEPFRLSVNGSVLRIFLGLFNIPDKNERFRLVTELPIQVKNNLCVLCDYLLCEGLFPHGLKDVHALYWQVLQNDNFISTHDGDVLDLANVRSKLVARTWSHAMQLPGGTCAMPGRALVSHNYGLLRMAFSPDGKNIAFGDLFDTEVLNVSTNFLHKIRDGGGYAISFSHDGNLLAQSGFYGRKVIILNARTGGLLHVFSVPSDWVTSIAFSPDDKIIAVALGANNKLCVMDVGTGRILHTFVSAQSYGMYDAAFSPDGQFLASSGDSYGSISLWDTATWALVRSWNINRGSVMLCCAFSPDGMMLASGSNSNVLSLWDVATGEKICEFLGHSRGIEKVRFSSDGQLLASCSDDNTVRLWSVETGQCLQIFTDHTDKVNDVAFSPDDKLLASCSDDGKVFIYDLDRNLSVPQLLLLNEVMQKPRLYTDDAQKERLVKICRTLPQDLYALVIEKMSKPVIETAFAGIPKKPSFFPFNLHVE